MNFEYSDRGDNETDFGNDGDHYQDDQHDFSGNEMDFEDEMRDFEPDNLEEATTVLRTAEILRSKSELEERVGLSEGDLYCDGMIYTHKVRIPDRTPNHRPIADIEGNGLMQWELYRFPSFQQDFLVHSDEFYTDLDRNYVFELELPYLILKAAETVVEVRLLWNIRSLIWQGTADSRCCSLLAEWNRNSSLSWDRDDHFHRFNHLRDDQRYHDFGSIATSETPLPYLVPLQDSNRGYTMLQLDLLSQNDQWPVTSHHIIIPLTKKSISYSNGRAKAHEPPTTARSTAIASFRQSFARIVRVNPPFDNHSRGLYGSRTQ